MIEAEKLPAAFGAGEAIRSRRAEFAGCRAAGMVAPRRLGAFDTAVQALGALWRFGRFGGDGRRSLAIPAVDYRRRQ
jgi:thiamine biosynthesis lipoprotein ApbE